MMDPIDRGFVRMAEGLIHLRRVEGRADGVPLLMLHASPGSSRGLEPLMRALAEADACPMLIAPDTLGHGDSAASLNPAPDIATYADATIRLLDALGVEQAVIYGAHTGARIACEAAVLHPDRVKSVILDGIGEYSAAMQAQLLELYAPEKKPDDYGTQMMWAFHFVRDQALHFPHYTRDPAHRLMTRAVPDAGALHGAALEVLKCLDTYHLAYHAAFRYPTSERLKLVSQPLVFFDAQSELPSLREQTSRLMGLCRNARLQSHGGSLSEKVAAILSHMG